MIRCLVGELAFYLPRFLFNFFKSFIRLEIVNMEISDMLPVREVCGHVVADRKKMAHVQAEFDRAAEEWYAEHPDETIPGRELAQALDRCGILCPRCRNAYFFTPASEDMLGITGPPTTENKFSKSGARIEVHTRRSGSQLYILAR